MKLLKQRELNNIRSNIEKFVGNPYDDRRVLLEHVEALEAELAEVKRERDDYAYGGKIRS